MATKKKSPVRKKKITLNTPLKVLIALCIVGALIFTYKKAFLPENNLPAELSNKPVRYSFGDRQNTTIPNLTTPMEISTVNTSSGWDESEIPKYGFSIQHPSDSKITQDEDTTFQYIRIQNYDGKNMSPEDRLPRGKYFLEILISDHKIGHNIFKNSSHSSCEETIENPQVVTIDGIKGYKGLIQGGDAPDIILSLCISKPDVDYIIKAYEDEPEVSERIINSFKFTK